uniref:Uncharacterized protein n=1 Tax=Nelumbo nucifera TaxID=4432 RepID=A0A822YJK1_NELNU|nr:TPA_asm: hypothetical protein HUJ06_010340 [Nelumbo nucifera]DAD31490.1 TPA_asm: hypothetical protein HUJ06_010342 [Nelumbo nucifera]
MALASTGETLSLLWISLNRLVDFALHRTTQTSNVKVSSVDSG